MNELMIFNNPEFGEIRIVKQNGEPWFVAADVCRALEHSNVSMALERLDDDEKAKLNLGLSGGPTNCVNEPGLYSLVLGSRKPEAKTFKRWITHEVLPTLRQTGTYSITPIVDQRYLTTDDYLRAATITSNCRNERLPYVLGFLEQAGFSVPKIEKEFPLPKSEENWRKAYEYMCDWVAANAGRYPGKTVGEYAVIPRPLFNQVCEDAGFAQKNLLKTLKEWGILRTQGSGKGFSMTARIGGECLSCIWMKLPRDESGEN